VKLVFSPLVRHLRDYHIYRLSKFGFTILVIYITDILRFTGRGVQCVYILRWITSLERHRRPMGGTCTLVPLLHFPTVCTRTGMPAFTATNIEYYWPVMYFCSVMLIKNTYYITRFLINYPSKQSIHHADTIY
jgi:hypothetical protein